MTLEDFPASRHVGLFERTMPQRSRRDRHDWRRPRTCAVAVSEGRRTAFNIRLQRRPREHRRDITIISCPPCVLTSSAAGANGLRSAGYPPLRVDALIFPWVTTPASRPSMAITLALSSRRIPARLVGTPRRSDVLRDTATKSTCIFRWLMQRWPANGTWTGCQSGAPASEF
jgi:hypothetical protein